jgi:uncharacterized protein YerC
MFLDELLRHQGVSLEQLEHVHLEQATNMATVAQLLVDKGICTEVELLEMRLRIIPMVEQAYQKSKEEQLRQ